MTVEHGISLMMLGFIILGIISIIIYWSVNAIEKKEKDKKEKEEMSKVFGDWKDLD
jgi:flagellar basal body-associated protein FliL